MKTTLGIAILTTFAALAVTAGVSAKSSLAADTRVFEMRTYHTSSPATLEALHTRFRNHSIKLLQKHGMTLVGFWLPMDADKGAGTTLVYLVAHTSREAGLESWRSFNADPEWVKVKAESEKDGPLAERVERVFMTPTDYSAMK